MKRKTEIMMAGTMLIVMLLAGCGGAGQQASEQAADSIESRQESARQTDVQENTPEEETAAGLEEPYVLIREINTKNGTVTEYAYDENGDKISETIMYQDKPDETLCREYATRYQEDGSRIVTESQTILQATGEAISNAAYEYDYNREGLLVRKAGFYDGELDGEVTYEYDTNGNLTYQSETKASSLGNAMAKKCEYDEDGNLVKETLLESEGNVNRIYTYEYDEDGKQILKHELNAAGEEIASSEPCEWKYEYDEKGRVIEEWKEGTEHGGKFEHYKYEYDEHGKLYKKEDLIRHTIYEYAPLQGMVQSLKFAIQDWVYS